MEYAPYACIPVPALIVILMILFYAANRTFAFYLWARGRIRELEEK